MSTRDLVMSHGHWVVCTRRGYQGPGVVNLKQSALQNGGKRECQLVRITRES